MDLKNFFTISQIYGAIIDCEQEDTCSFSQEKYLAIANAVSLHFKNGKKEITIRKRDNNIGYGMSNEQAKSFNWNTRKFDFAYQEGKLCYFETSLFSVLEEAYKYLYEI